MANGRSAPTLRNPTDFSFLAGNPLPKVGGLASGGGGGSPSGTRDYSSAYGGVPVLQTPGQLSNDMQAILNQAIPGFSGLSGQASGIIGSALSGQLPQDVQDLIRNASAEQAVMGGMPGTSNISGTLYGNKTLRDLGLTSLQRQDTGMRDLLAMLQGYSGTVAPTFGQAQEQEAARRAYAAAPSPEAAAKEQERLYNERRAQELATQEALYDKYANQAITSSKGPGFGGFGTEGAFIASLGPGTKKTGPGTYSTPYLGF